MCSVVRAFAACARLDRVTSLRVVTGPLPPVAAASAPTAAKPASSPSQPRLSLPPALSLPLLLWRASIHLLTLSSAGPLQSQPTLTKELKQAQAKAAQQRREQRARTRRTASSCCNCSLRECSAVTS